MLGEEAENEGKETEVGGATATLPLGRQWLVRVCLSPNRSPPAPNPDARWLPRCHLVGKDRVRCSTKFRLNIFGLHSAVGAIRPNSGPLHPSGQLRPNLGRCRPTFAVLGRIRAELDGLSFHEKARPTTYASICRAFPELWKIHHKHIISTVPNAAAGVQHFAARGGVSRSIA